MSKKTFVAIVIVAVLAVVGYIAVPMAIHNEKKPAGSTPQVGPTAEAQLPVGSGQYVAQPGDSCSGIARHTYCRAGDEKDVQAFLNVNSLLVSQEALRREVPYTDCPILAGQTYKVPDGWVSCVVFGGVSNGVVDQTQTQPVVKKSGSVWDYWGQLLIAVAFGAFLAETGLLRFARCWVRSNVKNPLRRTIRPQHWS